jgi:hypothetical protein
VLWHCLVHHLAADAYWQQVLCSLRVQSTINAFVLRAGSQGRKDSGMFLNSHRPPLGRGQTLRKSVRQHLNVSLRAKAPSKRSVNCRERTLKPLNALAARRQRRLYTTHLCLL